ncbi:MAG: hypothetical protein IK117_04660 [Bacteroidales bacterium]|nr:hypothetical protein [Bacteroidales bacterium]
MSDSTIKTNYSALYTLVIVFFFWGFIAASNGVFIPFCKHHFSLDQFQSQLIDFAFYTAYYIGALILFIISTLRKSDIVGKWGYKKSIVYGLLFSTVGAAAMIVGVKTDVYVGLLIGLFTVALGYSLQQTAANPFAIALGDPKTGSDRINLGGSINSFGTTIGPLILSFALFGAVGEITDDQINNLNLDNVVVLYSVVGILFLIAASIFHFSKKVPDCIQESEVETSNKSLRMFLIITVLLLVCMIPVFNSYKSEGLVLLNFGDIEMNRMYCLIGAFVTVIGALAFAHIKAKKDSNGWGALQYPQLALGLIALFFYVGVEVSIGSNLGELLNEDAFGGYSAAQIAPFVSMYWGSLMIGRWCGAVLVFNLKKITKIIALVAAPVLAFLLVIGVNTIAGHDMSMLYYYVICVLAQVVAFILCKEKPALTLLVFAVLAMVAMTIGVCTTGMVAVYAFLSGGLFCSIMWSNIYTLSTLGLGKYTSQGSSFLVMMILGGGIIPPIQGKLADIIGIHYSYIVPIIGYAYIAFFAFAAKRILTKQQIQIE